MRLDAVVAEAPDCCAVEACCCCCWERSVGAEVGGVELELEDPEDVRVLMAPDSDSCRSFEAEGLLFFPPPPLL